MSSLTENINHVFTDVQAIRQAIIAKGVSIPDGTSLDEYAAKIANINTGVDASSVTASAPDVLQGKIIVDKNGNKITGSMTDQGAKNATLNCGGSFTIPKGFHNGSGKVSASTLAGQTNATASSDDILSGKTAYVNGSKITGSLASCNAGWAEYAAYYNQNGTEYIHMNCFPNGYYNKINNLSWEPEIRIEPAKFFSGIGLSADKIVRGNRICGMDGTYYRWAQGSFTTDGRERFITCGFLPSKIILSIIKKIGYTTTARFTVALYNSLLSGSVYFSAYRSAAEAYGCTIRDLQTDPHSNHITINFVSSNGFNMNDPTGSIFSSYTCNWIAIE